MPSSNITIRRAELRDADTFVGFNQAMAWETEMLKLEPAMLLEGVKGLFAQPQYGFYVIAECESQAAGGLMITFEWSDWRNKVFWWVQSVYVQPQFRGQGVYRCLYDGVKRMAATENCCGFRLYVESTNKNAQAVYARLGMDQSHYVMFEDNQINSSSDTHS